MSTSRRLLKQAREAATKYGIDADDIVRLLAMMSRGVRPIVARDEDYQYSDFDPSARTDDPVHGRVVEVDQRTQLNALKLVSELIGLRSTTGATVNVNQATAIAGEGGEARAIATDDAVGALAVKLKGDGATELADALVNMDAAERRALAAKQVEDAKIRLIETTAQTVEEEVPCSDSE